MDALLETAALEFILRHEKHAAPDGAEDSTGWLPSQEERRSCCLEFRPAVWVWPQRKLYNHCKTYLHIAHLFHVPVCELRAEVARQLLERNLALAGRG